MATRRAKSVRELELPPAAETRQPPTGAARGPQARRWAGVAGVALAALACVAVYLLRYDHVAGFTVDDAWYILLAKALAAGQGYTLINSPSPGITPFYPPGFPFLLALVFKVAPNFPQNVWLLKAVSVAAMFGLGLASFWYFTRRRGLSSWVAGAMASVVVLNPTLVFFATSSVMSECVFAFAQLLTVVVIERCVSENGGRRALAFAALGAALASYVFLTRSMGVSLLVGVVLYLAWRRLWRAAAVFVLGVGLLVGPWMVYSRRHAPSEAMRAEQGGYIVYPYGEQFWMKTAGNPYAGNVTAGDIPARVFENLWQMAGEEAGRIFATPIYRSPRHSGFEFQGFKSGAGVISVALSLLILAGFIAAARERITLAEIVFPLSIGIIALWPWYPLRFAIPYLPFVVFYLVRGCQFVQELNRKLSDKPAARLRPVAALAVLGGVLALYAYDHAAYIVAKSDPAVDTKPVWLAKFGESEEALNWMNANLPRDGSSVVSSNPALVHLHTGLKTVSGGNIRESWGRWKEINVRYLAFVGYPSPMPPPGQSEKAYRQIYPGETGGAQGARPTRLGASEMEARLEGRWNNRVVDLGPPETRPDWGGRAASVSGAK
jgi:hypothetical protein